MKRIIRKKEKFNECKLYKTYSAHVATAERRLGRHSEIVSSNAANCILKELRQFAMQLDEKIVNNKEELMNK